MNARPVAAEFVRTVLLAYVVVGRGVTVEDFQATGASAPGFVVAQLTGAAIALIASTRLLSITLTKGA
jgi:hypothetical protein